MSLIMEYIMCYSAAYAIGFFSAVLLMIHLREYNARRLSKRVQYFRKHHVKQY
jgi:hypothetical protein